jgi:DNA-binding NarL/FixJ family response regulator
VSGITTARRFERQSADVGVIAEDRGARLRIAGALAAVRGLDVRVAASAGDVLDRGVLHDLLVFHCITLGAAELALFARLKRDAPELRIVVVCESANGRGARRAFDGGVDGLVFSEHLEAALAPTIFAVIAGQVAVPRELRTAVRKPALSSREKQVLGMVVLGFTNSEISGRLYLAESTVKSHLSSAFTKLGVRSRNEAAALILDPQGSLGAGILAITNGDSPLLGPPDVG